MPGDFNKKAPTKNEQMFYELAAHQDRMQHALWTNSSFMTALAKILNVAPEKIAEMMVNGNEEIKDFSMKINSSIEALEKEKHKDHDHAKDDHAGHDHAGHDHTDATAVETEETSEPSGV